MRKIIVSEFLTLDGIMGVVVLTYEPVRRGPNSDL